jgi:hypothetical protein
LTSREVSSSFFQLKLNRARSVTLLDTGLDLFDAEILLAKQRLLLSSSRDDLLVVRTNSPDSKTSTDLFDDVFVL